MRGKRGGLEAWLEASFTSVSVVSTVSGTQHSLSCNVCPSQICFILNNQIHCIVDIYLNKTSQDDDVEDDEPDGVHARKYWEMLNGDDDDDSGDCSV